MKGALLFWICFFSAISQSNAHELRPAYLEIKQSTADTYQIFWKVPQKSDRVLALRIQWPAHCQASSAVEKRLLGDAAIERYRLQCRDGLMDKVIAIEGLALTSTDVIVRTRFLNGSEQTQIIKPAQAVFEISTDSHRAHAAAEYFYLGVEHILLGFDHLLFVWALILISSGFLKTIKAVTAFTVSHSITLSLAALGVVHLPQPPVEAFIALSIVFVAREVLELYRGREGLTAQAPWFVAFCFGLLHGLGFAGALSEIGLPESNIPQALLFFSCGVEAGHFAFVAVVSGTAYAARRYLSSIPLWMRNIPPYVIGVTATFWLIERVAGFF